MLHGWAWDAAGRKGGLWFRTACRSGGATGTVDIVMLGGAHI